MFGVSFGEVGRREEGEEMICPECEYCNIHNGTYRSEEVSSDGIYYECEHPDLPQRNKHNPDSGISVDLWKPLWNKCPTRLKKQNLAK